MAADIVHLNPDLLDCIVQTPHLMEQIFDSLPDVLFYIKDVEGRYLWVNNALVARSGLQERERVIGRTSDQLFPVPGAGTLSQDLLVIRSKLPTREHLRLYRTASGDRFWCLSSKFPLMNAAKEVVGLIGISRDLPRPNERHRNYHRLEKFLEYIDRRLEHNVLISEAAKHASFSDDTLARLVLEVFQMTPKQLLMKKRIDRACRLLEDTNDPITLVSGACGYADQSAFARQFKVATHMTPARYRSAHKPFSSSRLERHRASD